MILGCVVILHKPGVLGPLILRHCRQLLRHPKGSHIMSPVAQHYWSIKILYCENGDIHRKNIISYFICLLGTSPKCIQAYIPFSTNYVSLTVLQLNLKKIAFRD